MRFILIMGLMSILFGGKAASQPKLSPLPIDLGTFKCGQTFLGSQIDSTDPYASHFDSNGIAQFDASGIELGMKDDVLDYAFVTLANFAGGFLKNGSKISISTQTTPEEIVSLFGEPYWTDHKDDEETILFYEWQNGQIELQFEFPGKRKLGFITLSRNGVLSDLNQRKAYGVTKEWPPN